MAKSGVPMSLNVEVSFYLARLVGALGALVTLVVNPWTSFDPINLPKMVMLSIGTCGLLFFYLGERISNRQIVRIKRKYLLLLSLVFFGLALSAIGASRPFAGLFWGEWGRNTGILTYVCFAILFVLTTTLWQQASQEKIISIFMKLNYFIAGYATLQLMELDPINWSQSGPFATLGNINFTSGMLGMAVVVNLATIVTKKKTSKTSILFLTFVSIGYLSIIVISESIQGLGVSAVGCTFLITTWLILRRKKFLALLFFAPSTILGCLLLLGTAGIGPLSKSLMQYSVVFRLDYWKAGFQMFLSNPLLGVGMDSYGDFYREFRDQIAVERTGPQRVTNTAHNIFLDLLSGGGASVGVPLISMSFVIPTLLIIRSLIKLSLTTNGIITSAAFIGFSFYSLISINQIGVGVWGFIFAGLTCASIESNMNLSDKESITDFPREKIKGYLPGSSYSNKKGSKASVNKEVEDNLAKRRILTSVLGSIIGLAISLSPLKADIDYLSAARFPEPRVSDAKVREILHRTGSSDFHWERYIDRLRNSGRFSEAAQLSEELVSRSPRNFLGWTFIWLSGDLVSEEQKLESARQLVRLDPNNRPLLETINASLGTEK